MNIAKFRKVASGGIKFYQIILCGLVFSIGKAHTIDGGDNKYHISIMRRKETNL